jgi:O-Antigen ligase
VSTETTSRSLRPRQRLGPGVSWFGLTLLSILAGSSTIAAGASGRSAPIFWVELWVLIAYPIHLLTARRGRFPRLGWFWVVAGVSIAWEASGLILSADPVRGLRVLAIHVIGLLVYIFVVSVALSRRGAEAVGRMLVLAPVLLLAFSLPSLLAAGGLQEAVSSRAIETALGRSNALATPFSMFAVLCLGVWANVPRMRRSATIGGLSATLGLALTGSRAGFLATAIGVAALLLWVARERGVGKSALAAVVILLLIFAIRETGVTRALEARLLSIEQPERVEESSVQNVFIRLDYWRVAWGMFVDQPVRGEGLGSFGDFYRQSGAFDLDEERQTDPHNQLLLLLAETGVVGLALASLLLRYMLTRAWPSRDGHGRWVKASILAAVLAALMHSLAEPVFRNPASVGLVALLLGLAANASFCGSAPGAAPKTSDG